MRTLIYLDESGDLGWLFDKPYRYGGSSRMLTISAVCLPQNKVALLKRIVKSLYIKRKRPLKNELKYINLNTADKQLFVQQLENLLHKHQDITLHSITINKQAVANRLRKDPNILYNYMVKSLLLQVICENKQVDFIPDRRSERVNSKWNMDEYLQQMIQEAFIEQKFQSNHINQSCHITPMDSAKSMELQFIDFYTGLVWAMYEFSDTKLENLEKHKNVIHHYLFFD